MRISPSGLHRLGIGVAMVMLGAAFATTGPALAQTKADPGCGMDPTCGGRTNVPRVEQREHYGRYHAGHDRGDHRDHRRQPDL